MFNVYEHVSFESLFRFCFLLCNYVYFRETRVYAEKWIWYACIPKRQVVLHETTSGINFAEYDIAYCDTSKLGAEDKAILFKLFEIFWK